MPKSNRKCNYCGSPYYVCKACVGNQSWKNVACTPECFKKLFSTNNNDIAEDSTNSKVTKLNKVAPIVDVIGGVEELTIIKENGNRYPVVGYDIDLMKFDVASGETFGEEDIAQIELSCEELADIKNSIKSKILKDAEMAKKAVSTKSRTKKSETPITSDIADSEIVESE